MLQRLSVIPQPETNSAAERGRLWALLQRERTQAQRGNASLRQDHERRPVAQIKLPCRVTQRDMRIEARAEPLQRDILFALFRRRISERQRDGVTRLSFHMQRVIRERIECLSLPAQRNEYAAFGTRIYLLLICRRP